MDSVSWYCVEHLEVKNIYYCMYNTYVFTVFDTDVRCIISADLALFGDLLGFKLDDVVD